MTPADFTRVMALAQALDPRLTITKESLAAWYEIAGHLDVEVAVERVKRHYAAETRGLMPVDLLGGKVTPSPQSLPCPPVDPDDVAAYRGWLQQYARAVTTGDPDPERAADRALGIARTSRVLTARPLALPQMKEA